MASKFPSLEELLRNFPEKTLEKPCSNKHIVDIADEITKWREIVPHLGLREVEEENIDRNHHDVQIQRREMLRTWRQKLGSKATYGSLVEAFYKAARVDLVEKVADLLTKEASTSSLKLGPSPCKQDASSLLSSTPLKPGGATSSPGMAEISSVPVEKLMVEIGNRTYSVMKAPPKDSAIVIMNECYLLGEVDPKTLMRDLERVGKFVGIAYNSVGAASSKPEFVELQMRIQDLGYDITKLCKKSAITVAQFKKASGSILVDLHFIYEYLLDNHEEKAIEMFSSFSKLAGSMAKATIELHQDFEKQAEEVQEALKDCTRNTKGQQTHDVRGLNQLSLIMMKAALFWKQMQLHCQSLAESEMQNQVEKALKLSEEKRLKVWTSKGFKIKAVKFYAGWVALNGVCTKYIEQIQKDLYEYLIENPTYELSRRSLFQLANEFEADLEVAQHAFTYKSTAAEEEIKSLSAPL